jgi:aspartyl-tRNA(Asn)/glutamyl-tRNA(Gln) amidotransferase subunit A
MTALLDQGVSAIADAVRAGDATAVSLTNDALERIDAARMLNAVTSVDRDGALAAAEAIDQRRGRGEALGALAGVPIAVKDALCTRGQPTTAGSAILTRELENGTATGAYRPPYDATAVARLRAADAIVVAKTNMDEMAMGSSGENSAYGPTLNPWDQRRAPGGSSSGSAVAVAAGLTPASLGSDTGGSVRQPAAFTGTVGLKPSYGRVSRYGLIAFASSLDQVGPMTRDVRGAAMVLQAIAGSDGRDATCVDRPVEPWLEACDRGVEGLRIGLPAEYFGDGLAPEVEASVRAAVDGLLADGATVHPVTLPHTRYAVATYYVVATAECSSNLARFDGVRFGRRIDGGDIGEMYRRTRSSGFGHEVKRRVLLGTFVLSAGYYEAYYQRAQRVRRLIADDFDKAFEEVDVIATPTSPTVAFELGSRTADPLSMYLADVYTLGASLGGQCAVSLCSGLGAESGLPVGLQLIGPSFGEATILAAAASVEARRGTLRWPGQALGTA